MKSILFLMCCMNDMFLSEIVLCFGILKRFVEEFFVSYRRSERILLEFFSVGGVYVYVYVKLYFDWILCWMKWLLIFGVDICECFFKSFVFLLFRRVVLIIKRVKYNRVVWYEFLVVLWNDFGEFEVMFSVCYFIGIMCIGVVFDFWFFCVCVSR